MHGQLNKLPENFLKKGSESNYNTFILNDVLEILQKMS